MSQKCSQDGCCRAPRALGYCSTHYKPAVAKGLIGPRIPCASEGCSKFKTHKDGLCEYHHRKQTTAYKAKEKRRREKPERKAKRKTWDAKYNETPKRKEALLRYTARRKKQIELATPPWADKAAIQAFYDNCPAGYAVDHVIPLLGKDVCGLHTVENFQYLTIEENVRKGNRT